MCDQDARQSDRPTRRDRGRGMILQLIWVAAHHGLRRQRLDARRAAELWGYVHDLTAALGHPPAPGPR
jgi:hypothetical protein